MSGGIGGCAPEFDSEFDFEAGDESEPLAKNDEAPIEVESKSESAALEADAGLGGLTVGN